MKHQEVTLQESFKVLIGNERSQAAEMVLDPGDSEGGPENRHQGADQWLFVVAGNGEATINGAKVPLRSGSLLLIEKGEIHEIRNTGESQLRTLNIYLPPAYTSSGEELPAGKG